jgi:hypothetical protein
MGRKAWCIRESAVAKDKSGDAPTFILIAQCGRSAQEAHDDVLIGSQLYFENYWLKLPSDEYFLGLLLSILL